MTLHVRYPEWNGELPNIDEQWRQSRYTIYHGIDLDDNDRLPLYVTHSSTQYGFHPGERLPKNWIVV